jgi:hypothetical protein
MSGEITDRGYAACQAISDNHSPRIIVPLGLAEGKSVAMEGQFREVAHLRNKCLQEIRPIACIALNPG